MNPAIITREDRERRIGLGAVLQKAIHATVDMAPIPTKTKGRIKNCRSCGRRARALDRHISFRIKNANPK